MSISVFSFGFYVSEIRCSVLASVPGPRRTKTTTEPKKAGTKVNHRKCLPGSHHVPAPSNGPTNRAHVATSTSPQPHPLTRHTKGPSSSSGGLTNAEVVVEVIACREGLALVSDLAVQRIKVSSDCVNAVKCIRGDKMGPYGPIVRLCMKEVGRKAKGDAHRLARSSVFWLWVDMCG